MLKAINIKNIILIDEIELDFEEGFTSLTGETGAGKSIILTSLGLLLGKKIDKSVIRFGQDSAEVFGEFAVGEKLKNLLEENELESDELLIRRKITSDGKSKQFVNDTPVSLKLLAEIGSHLVEIHSQHEQSSLFDNNIQREILDKYAGINLADLQKVFADWKEAYKELEERKKAIEKAKHDEDYLRHVLDELTELNPQEGEETELAELRSNMKNYENISATLNEAEAELTRDKNIENALLNAQRTLMRANNDMFANAIEVLERASIEVNEVFASFQEIANSMESDPARLNEVEERLFAIRGLARKYDCHPDQLADYRQEIEGKLDLLGDEEKGIKELKEQVLAFENEYMKLAKQVSEKRKIAALGMQKSVEEELKPLAMGGAKFALDFTDSTASATGIDKIEFMASTNPGVPIAPIAKIASGGEISRFMLALKVVLLNVSAAPTIIFDEIDTGTGGSVAAAIGERLAKLGKKLQVFVVTHLPQVAAQAGNHLKISKAEKAGSNFTNVEVLNGEERKDELARMLSGAELTDEARAQALKLMG